MQRPRLLLRRPLELLEILTKYPLEYLANVPSPSGV